MGQALAEKTGARWGSVVEGNGAAAWVAGCVPHRSVHSQLDAIAAKPGLSAGNMIHSPRKGYLLLNVEPALDCADAKAAADAMKAADFSVALSVFDLRDSVEADVLLPVTPYSETSGSYVNCEGRLQSTAGAVPPPGEARPAWKVLRVLGNLFDVEGFDYITSEDVRNEISWAAELATVESSRPEAPAPKGSRADGFGLARIADVPLYRVDALVRRAVSLQNTGDNPPAMAHLGNEEAQRLGVAEGDQVDVAGSVASVSLPVHINAAVPPGSVYVPSGWEATEPLGASPFVKVSKV